MVSGIPTRTEFKSSQGYVRNILITLANFVAEDAVSCEPVSLFPVYQANIREFVRIVLSGRISLQRGRFFQ